MGTGQGGCSPSTKLSSIMGWSLVFLIVKFVRDAQCLSAFLKTTLKKKQTFQLR